VLLYSSVPSNIIIIYSSIQGLRNRSSTTNIARYIPHTPPCSAPYATTAPDRHRHPCRRTSSPSPAQPRAVRPIPGVARPHATRQPPSSLVATTVIPIIGPVPEPPGPVLSSPAPPASRRPPHRRPPGPSHHCCRGRFLLSCSAMRFDRELYV
jgi:hypothetical protein